MVSCLEPPLPLSGVPEAPPPPPTPSPRADYLEEVVKLVLITHQVGQVGDKAEAFLVGGLVVGVIRVDPCRESSGFRASEQPWRDQLLLSRAARPGGLLILPDLSRVSRGTARAARGCCVPGVFPAPTVTPPCGRPPEQWGFLQVLWSPSTGSSPLESEASIVQKGLSQPHVEITMLGNKNP